MSMGSHLTKSMGGYKYDSVAQRLKKERYHGRGKLKDRIFNQTADKVKSWDVKPSEEYFEQLFRVSKNQIIWGGNYFGLPPTRGVICWDKMQPWENFSQWEMAWTSFDYPAALFKFSNTGGANVEKKIHPTQKPVALYAWLLQRFAKPGNTVLDTHLGSGSSRVAAYKLGFDFYGCEIDREYFEASKKRFEEKCLNVIQTESGDKIEQLSLF
ncbi:MAG: DNA methyltransferase [Bacteroidales bacterium]